MKLLASAEQRFISGQQESLGTVVGQQGRNRSSSGFALMKLDDTQVAVASARLDEEEWTEGPAMTVEEAGAEALAKST